MPKPSPFTAIGSNPGHRDNCSHQEQIYPHGPENYKLKDVISPTTVNIKWRRRNSQHNPAMEHDGNDQMSLPRNLGSPLSSRVLALVSPLGDPILLFGKNSLSIFPRKVFHFPLSFLATTGADSFQSSL